MRPVTGAHPRTGRAVLLLHGYTLAPDQYDELAEEFFDRGYNVWVPLPGPFPYRVGGVAPLNTGGA
ncbi:hypothetical protein ACQP2C_28310 [Micromonospora zamorensis]|uniref:hypothetical protein n=1 Tax=Micromonospora zamorensis TaxID=709883 RepID=UPI003D98DAD0